MAESGEDDVEVFWLRIAECSICKPVSHQQLCSLLSRIFDCVLFHILSQAWLLLLVATLPVQKSSGMGNLDVGTRTRSESFILTLHAHNIVKFVCPSTIIWSIRTEYSSDYS